MYKCINYEDYFIVNKKWLLWNIIIIYWKKEPLKKAQNNKIANVACSVWCSLFMDSSVKCNLYHVFWSSLTLEALVVKDDPVATKDSVPVCKHPCNRMGINKSLVLVSPNRWFCVIDISYFEIWTVYCKL